MIEISLNFVAAHALEILSLIVAVAALVYAALALRAANQAVHLTKETNIAALKLKARDELSVVERSFHELQENCQQTRRQWDLHRQKHFPAFSQNFDQPTETNHISRLEMTGRRLLQDLKDEMPDGGKATDFEGFINRAKVAAIQIKQLTFDLELPKPIGD
ncbi:MAG: hypothetical protein P8X50_11610 [Maritimibacter sp.]